MRRRWPPGVHVLASYRRGWLRGDVEIDSTAAEALAAGGGDTVGPGTEPAPR